MESFGLIDGILKEPVGGAHADHEAMAKTLKKHIKATLEELIPMDPDARVTLRIEKYSKMGKFHETAQ